MKFLNRLEVELLADLFGSFLEPLALKVLLGTARQNTSRSPRASFLSVLAEGIGVA